VEEWCVGGVEIFRLGIRLQGAAAKGDDLPAGVLDRKHEPATKPVIRLAAAILLDRQSGLDDLALREALGLQVFEGLAPIIRAIAEPVLAPGIRLQAAPFEIGPGLRPFARAQAFFIKGRCRLTGRDQAQAAIILFLAFRRRLGQLHPSFVGEFLDRLHEGEAFGFHDEGDDIAANAGGEAFEDLLLVIDVEARRLLIGEGRQADPFLALLFQLHLSTDHFRRPNARFQLVDKAFGNTDRGAHLIHITRQVRCAKDQIKNSHRRFEQDDMVVMPETAGCHIKIRQKRPDRSNFTHRGNRILGRGL